MRSRLSYYLCNDNNNYLISDFNLKFSQRTLLYRAIITKLVKVKKNIFFISVSLNIKVGTNSIKKIIEQIKIALVLSIDFLISSFSILRLINYITLNMLVDFNNLLV